MRSHETRQDNRPLPLGFEPAGRFRELTVMRQVVHAARAGRGGALVLRGPAGIGKSALLDSVAMQAAGFQVVRMRVVEAEAAYACAGMQMVWEGLRGVGDGAAQRDPGYDRSDESPAELGRRTQRLLGAAAAHQPLICVIDDAQWLDPASAKALAYALRRLAAHRVAVFLADRGDGHGDGHGALADLPSLPVGGLPYTHLRLIVDTLISGPLDEAVVGRMIRESRGNPGLLTQALNGVSPARFAGGFGLSDEPGASAAVAEYAQFFDRLPESSRRLLALASADPTGDAALLHRAAARLGLTPDAFEPVESAAGTRLSPQVTFPSPALRTWIYRRAGATEREQAHRALGLATDERSAPDRRAWHLAHAGRGSGEDLADALERAVPSARRRGGPAAAAAFLELATRLTGDGARRDARALSAAVAKRRAGDPDAAAHLLADAGTGTADPLLRLRIERERALIAFATHRGRSAANHLVQATKELERFDESSARETRVDTVTAACLAGCGSVDLAASHPAHVPPAATMVDAFLAGLAARLTGDAASAQQPLRAAVEMASAGREPDAASSLWMLAWAAWDVGDDVAWDALSERAVRRARQAGDAVALPYALAQRSLAAIHRGDLSDALAVAAQAERLFAAIGSPPLPLGALLCAGWLGDEGELRCLADAARSEAGRRGEGIVLSAAGLAQAVLYNGLGRYDLALDAACDAAQRNDLGFALPSLAELVEAAVRGGDVKNAERATEELTARAQAAGTPWALGIAARAQAMSAGNRLAEPLYQEAIELLGQSRGRADLARTQLLFGEWLRRQGRRIDARVHLRAAHSFFHETGAAAFSERARREYAATGEKARSRSVDALGELTPQETRIAALARDGLTNPEIGALLYISPRTVEYHLHKVFDKLGIASRQKLHLVLTREAEAPSPLCP